MKLATDILITLIISLLTCHVDSVGRGSIVIEDNGYGNILIAIAERVTPNSQLIQRIKSAYTETSAFLYEATRKRAYLHNITILVPGSWPSDPSYEPIKNETPDKSNIVVDNPDDVVQDNKPFTCQPSGCGVPGIYTQLTPAFLLENEVASQYGEYGRVLLREWSHLRYGVFDELSPDGKHVYIESDGVIEGIRCSDSLTGEVKTIDGRECTLAIGVPEDGCRFTDHNLLGRYGSIMYKSTLSHIFYFCDNDQDDELKLHNSKAPTSQNNACEGKSIWEVLRENEDFSNGANPPRDLPTTTPNFRIVRHTQMQTVLVLDVSSSMTGQRLEKLNQGCSTYISSIITNGEALGIVTFHSLAQIRHDLITISNSTRQGLLNELPTRTSGATSIGAGIRLSLEVLQYGDKDAGTLIVVSDGEENVAPTIEDVWEEVISSGVTVHTIAITDETDSNLDALAQATGGLSFIYSQSDDSNAINEAFRKIGELNAAQSERSYSVLSQASDTAGGTSFTETVVIDDSLGRQNQFIFDYSADQGLAIEIHSPTGKMYNTNSTECQQDATFKVYRFTFGDSSYTGEWFFNVTNPSLETQSVSVTVVSKSSTPEDYPIVAQAFWGRRILNLTVSNFNSNWQTIYVIVSKGAIPILYANVTATVERPGSVPQPQVDMILSDNGAGADLFANDGIYSAYFIQFTSNGRYGLKVRVTSNPATVISPSRIIGQPSTSSVPDRPTGDFQRIVNGGSFELSYLEPGLKYPPGRIHDFQLTEVDRDTNQMKLEWTAVGAELDFGTLSMYDLRFSHEFDNLTNEFELQPEVTEDMIVAGSSLIKPQSHGQLEAITLVIQNSSLSTYYFAIKAVNLNGTDATRGSMSNIVSATFREIMAPGDSEGPNLGLILGVTFGILAVIIIVVIVSILVVRKKTSKPQRNGKTSSVYVDEAVNIGFDNETYETIRDYDQRNHAS